jgi:hypothetical protein
MGLWCLAGTARTVEAGEAAWRAGDVAGLGAMLGLPCCCMQAHVADDPLQRPEWAALQGKGLTSWQTNYTLHRLGLSPAPWLPCRPDCARTLDWLADQEPSAGLDEILSWPLDWSALHGIAQVLTPVFRLVHDTVATGRKTQHVRGALEMAPAESATGLVFPYLPPHRRPLEVRRTFRQGIENIGQSASPVEVGRVRSLADDALPRPLSEPLLLGGAAAGWPALSLWSTATIASLVAEASASPGRSLEVGSAPLPAHMIADVGFIELGLAEAKLVIGLEPGGTGGLLRPPTLNDAWCALIRGRRRWVFCAPGSEADLVDCEPDLLDRSLRDRLSRRGLDIRECDQGPGDVIGLPAGWWWQVRNLEPTLVVVA